MGRKQSYEVIRNSLLRLKDVTPSYSKPSNMKGQALNKLSMCISRSLSETCTSPSFRIFLQILRLMAS